MVESPMCPAEVMAKARYEYRHQSDWNWYKDNYPADADNMIEEDRVALRALAEMEPNERMRNFFTDQTISLARSYIMQSAKEGENS